VGTVLSDALFFPYTTALGVLHEAGTDAGAPWAAFVHAWAWRVNHVACVVGVVRAARARALGELLLERAVCEWTVVVCASVAYTLTWFEPLVAQLLARALLIFTPALWLYRLRALAGGTILPLGVLWRADRDLALIGFAAALILIPPLALLKRPGCGEDYELPTLVRAAVEPAGPQAEQNQLVLAGLVLAYVTSLYDRRDVMRLVVGERRCRRAAAVLGALSAALLLNGWFVHLAIPDRVLDAVHGEWA